MLSLNVVVLFPADGETEMCDQTSVHPLTPFESPPLADMEMLLVEHIFQTLVPPVCCCQCHIVHSLPDGAACLLKLAKRFQNLTNGES